MNIGSNAVKYNHDGGSVTVTCREVSYTDTTAEYELTCTDTGISMSEEFQQYTGFFSLFSRLQNHSSVAY